MENKNTREENNLLLHATECVNLHEWAWDTGSSRTLYNLHYVKVEIRTHSSIVKERRRAVKFCLAKERVVEESIGVVLVVVGRDSMGFMIFYLDLYVGYIFTYWCPHLFTYTFLISSCFCLQHLHQWKLKGKIKTIKYANLYCNRSSQHQSPVMRLIVWYDIMNCS